MDKDADEIGRELNDVKQRMAGPLGFAVGACAVGFIVGLAAPLSDRERRTLRSLRETALTSTMLG
jgi:hypothetical protein